MFDRIQDRCRGRWRDILLSVGVPPVVLNGKHQACPFCGGKDRFRFDDKGGDGRWICAGCESGKGGNGVDFVMKFLGVDFMGAKARIDKELPSARVALPKATMTPLDVSKINDTLWRQASPLTGFDPGALYLGRRGLNLSPWPSQLRHAINTPYLVDAKTKTRTYHPALLAKFIGADNTSFMIQRLYLTEKGCKARVEECRRMTPGKVPDGGAVRLANSAEIMGVAEGIETAMAAMLLFKIPVWATLTASLMQKWKPPKTAKRIMIFGDNDPDFHGAAAAYGLAYKLAHEGFDVDPRIPEHQGEDWLDVYQRENGIEDLSKDYGDEPGHAAEPFAEAVSF
jgi:putative DNA primase/helicase